MKTTKYILTLLLTVWCAVGNLYAVEKSYYTSVDGKSGTALREALTTLTYTKHTTDLGYNWTFDGIDIVNGEILDIYSTCSWTTSQQGKSYSNICDGYNREHVVPQSVFKEAAPQKGDRHHLFLADGQVNNLRSSYPFGETNVTTAFSGYSNGNKALGKLGAASSGYSGTVYEPDEEYKGDIARAVLYMAIRYATSDVCRKYGGTANSYPVTAWSNAMFSGSLSTNYGLSNNAVTTFLKWHRADPPSAKEIARNNGVEKKQGNRNPFIDLPDLVEYLWGNKAGQTVNLSSLDIATGGGSVPTTYEITLNRNGATETVTCSGTYTLPTASTEADACDGWAFAGWSSSSSINTTTAPTYTISVSSATTLYAVYSNTTNAAPRRAKMASATYNKVTATSGITDGQYLIVYETGSKAFKGSLETLDAASNGIDVTISSSSITGDYEANEFTISASNGAMQSASGKYIGNASNSNGLTSSTTALTNTLSIDNDGNFVAVSSGGAYLRYNKDAAQSRFRYFKSSSYTGQQAIQLYKKSSGSSGGGSTTTYKTTPDCGSAHTITLSSGGTVSGGTFEASATSAYQGATITLYAEPSDGYALGSWSVTKQGGGSVTVTDNQFTMPDANVTVSATFNALPTYDIKFYNNGSQIGSTQSVYQGGTPNIPSVEGCEGYTFVGWWTSALATDNTASKSWIEDFTVSQAQSYYAIFEHSTGSGGSKTITLDATKDTSFPKEGITLTASNGDLTTGTDYRIYKGATLTITSSVGDMSSIAFTFDGSYNGGGWATSYTPNSNTWTSPACTSGSSGKQARITKIVVNVGGGGSTYYTSTTNCSAACTTLDAPQVTATPGNGQITLTWAAVDGATGYNVTVSKGAGYTTECGSAASIGNVTGTTTKTCVISGLTNGLTYTTSVVANATSATCDSEADSDTATPQDCTPWDDPTLSWNKYSLNTTTDKTATKTLSGTTHGTLSFESSDTDVLTVNQTTGAVTAVGSGEATVTAHWMAAGGYCEKTMTSSTFEVTGALTISFDANGGSGTMTAQTVTYKQTAAIKENSFSREGYSFAGWATSADGDKVYDDKQSVAFMNSQTLYAVWQLNSHNVSFTPSPSGATVTVNGQSTSPQAANYGETVTVHIAPANHYTITTVSIQGTTSHTDIAQTGSGETRTFTMPDENVTISVEMNAESQYTATFYNGTATFATVNGYVDDDIAAPTGTPTSCDDETFTFVGWVATAQTTEVTTSPQILTFPQVMINGGVSYYALFRRSEGGSGGEASVTFKTASQDGSTEYSTDSDIKTNIVDTYTGIASFEGSKAYPGKSGVKLGSSKNAGSITLNLSSPITTDKITVEAVKYGTDAGDLKIEVNGSTAFGSAMSPAGGTLEFTDDEMEISSLTVLTTSARAYVASISLGGGGTSYYTTAPECAACENQVTITKGTEEHGTFTLSKASGSYDNCKSNVSVTVSGITPDEGYYCTGVTATGSHMHVAVSGPDGSGNYTVAYAKGYSVTSTITANFAAIPTHTVTWSANGSTTTATYSEGAAITFPTTATGCDGMEFMGWSAVEVEEQDEAPTYTTSATMGDHDVTYYAVFATKTTSGGGTTSVDDVITLDDTGASGTTYSAWTGLSKTSSAVYAGNNAGGNSSIQLRTNSSNSGIVSTTSGGKIKKVVIAWNSNTTAGRVLDVYGSNSAYTAASNLYDNAAKGTLLGSLSYDNNETELTISGDYAYVGIRSRSGALYLNSVTFTWSSGSGSSTTTYSGYTTSCTPCENKVTMVKGTPEHGSFTLDLAEGEYNNCHSAGLVVTVSSNTPDEDYQFKEITQTGIPTGVTIDNDAKTVTYAKDITGTSTINVVFEPKPTYTIRFYNNGALVGSAQTVTEGHSAVKPSNPTVCSDDYTFVGWWTRELALDNTAAYTWVTNFTATKDQDYYAVYEYTEGGSSEQIYSKSPSGSGDLVANGEGTKYTLTIATGVTVTISGWSNNVPVYHSDGQWRIYGGSNVVIASTLGNISKIQFSSTQNNLSTSQGSYSSQVWTGDASSVTFTNSATQSRITSISVTVGGGGITYYTTAPDCEAPIVTSAKMLVAEYGGARVALMHDNTNTVAALPLMCFGGNYFIPNKDKNGNTVTKVPDPATLTWQVMERTDGYYIKSGEQFLAQTEGEFEMDNESFLWPKQGALRLAYDADIESFVVAAGEQGDLLPGITPVDVPGSISLTELNSPRDLTIGRFGTICLPHAVALPFTWGVKVYSIEGAKMTDDKLVGIYMVEETEMLTAGKPYLIEALTEKMNMWYATGAPTADKAVEAKGLVGNLGAEFYIDPTQSDYYYVLSNNQLRRVGENAKVKVGQYKAYFDLEGLSEPATMPQAYAFKVMYVENNEQVETDLNEVPATINWDEPVYNILGMRVDRNATGVLIQGGTKFIIRVP